MWLLIPYQQLSFPTILSRPLTFHVTPVNFLVEIPLIRSNLLFLFNTDT